MKSTGPQRESTRRAILGALAEVIVESGTNGFSVQDVADRAGVTHRTVYNHYPTREALNDALAVYVEEQMAAGASVPPEIGLPLREVASVIPESFRIFAAHESLTRAYVMLMVAARGPGAPTKARTKRFSQLVGRELGPLPRHVSREIAATVRMFLSTTGWHLLTEHYGLTHAQAAAAASWAIRVLTNAAADGDLPDQESNDA